MAIPTVTLNETTPAGSAYVRDGDNRICEYKKQVREILEVDHYFPSSGQSDSCGRHKRLTLLEIANLGTGSDGICFAGAQIVGVVPEFVFTDEANTDVQITSGGKINAPALGGVYPAANVAALVTLLSFIYPVGCIYTTVVATNPATVFGFGTWAAFGAGKVLVGFNAAETEFDLVEETGGEKTHTLIAAEMPVHTHTFTLNLAGRDGGSSPSVATGQAPTQSTPTYTPATTGSGGAHNNLQPYIVVYMWKRTA